MPLAGRFRLGFFTPLPAGAFVGGIDINPDMTSLQYQMDVAGGFQSMNVGLDVTRGAGLPLRGVPRATVDPMVEGLFHVQCTRGQQLCWEGRISKVDSVGDHLVGFQAKGYGVWGVSDGVYFASKGAPVNTTLITSGQILQQAIPTAAPLLSIGTGAQFIDPGVPHAPAEFDQKGAHQVIDQFTQEASALGVIVDYYVYENRTVYLIPRNQPDLVTAFPTYQLSLDASVPLSRIFDDVVGTVYVSYTDATTGLASGPVTATDPTFAARYPGLLRQKLIQGGTMTASGAQAFARGYISQNSRPLITTTITRKQGDGLSMWAGGEMFPELVRPGQWVLLGEPLGPGNPGYVPPLIIVRTNYDAGTGTLTAELGARGPSQGNMLQELRRIAVAAKGRINPNTRAAA